MITVFANTASIMAEGIIYFLLFEAYEKRKDEYPSWYYYVGYIAICLMFWFCNQFFLYSLSNNIGMVFSAVVISSILYQGSIRTKIVVAVTGGLICLVTEVLTLYMIAMVFHLTVRDIVHILEYQLLGIVISKISAIAAANAIRVRQKRKRVTVTTTYWLIFFLLFVNAVVIAFLLFRTIYEIHTTAYNDMALVATLGLFVSSFFILYLFERQSKQEAEIRRQTLNEQHLNSQLKYFDDMLSQQKALRRFEHDVPNQFIALRSYLEHAAGGEGLLHLDALEKSFGAIRPSIDTGNIALDAIINTKKSIAESKAIKFDTKIQVADHIPIASEDVCVIFGNALDNAIEACDRLMIDDKKITVTLFQNSDALFCRIINSAPPGQVEMFRTSKSDPFNHGFGFINIKDALEKYQSEPVIQKTDEQFILSFVINLSKINEKA